MYTTSQKCQENIAEWLKASGLLQPLEIPYCKWESVLMDFNVSFAQDTEGERLYVTNHGSIHQNGSYSIEEKCEDS